MQKTKEYLFGAENVEEVYTRLLGKDSIPKSPKEMPSEIFLPGVMLGNLEEAIFSTLEDGNERSQQIYFHPGKREVRYGNLFIGSPSHVATRDVLLRIMQDLYQAYLASFFSPPEIDKLFPYRRALVSFHTHPNHDEKFSIPDIRSTMVSNRAGSLITLVGADTGIRAALRTNQSISLPLSPFLTFLRLREAQRREQQMLNSKDPKDAGKNRWDNIIRVYEEETGLVQYSWEPPVSYPGREMYYQWPLIKKEN